jgi:hypothetical protein
MDAAPVLGAQNLCLQESKCVVDLDSTTRWEGYCAAGVYSILVTTQILPTDTGCC